jgi:HEAT repeat protein
MVRHKAAEALGDMNSREALIDLREAVANDPDAIIVAAARIAVDQISGESREDIQKRA